MWDYIVKGGICMVPLLMCSIAMVAVLLERRRALEVLRVDDGPFRERLMELLRNGDVDAAVKLCEDTPVPIAEILVVGLRRYRQLRALGRPDDQIEQGVVKAMEDHAPYVVNNLEKYLGVLVTVGNVAPLFGFLGTVTGMISSFNAIAAAGGMRPEIVASGISEALITTAAGLFIAIPAFVAYNHFTTRVKDFVLGMEAASAELVETVVEQSRSAGQPPRSA
jgi:biopolymer transport protein ExbB